MKIRLTLSSLLAAAFCVAAPAAHAQLKVATVDMNKVFSGYYKTKDAENKINDARESAKKDLDERMESHKQMLDEINQLNKDIDNPALSATAKADRNKKRDEKITQIKALEQEIQEFKNSREKQLQEQAVRMRNTIVEEIMKVVNEEVKEKSYDMVLDKSGQSLNGVLFVLFSQDKMDFSEQVILTLNKTRPAATAPAATPTASRSPCGRKTFPRLLLPADKSCPGRRIPQAGRLQGGPPACFFLNGRRLNAKVRQWTLSSRFPPFALLPSMPSLAELLPLLGGELLAGSPETPIGRRRLAGGGGRRGDFVFRQPEISPRAAAFAGGGGPRAARTPAGGVRLATRRGHARAGRGGQPLAGVRQAGGAIHPTAGRG